MLRKIIISVAVLAALLTGCSNDNGNDLLASSERKVKEQGGVVYQKFAPSVEVFRVRCGTDEIDAEGKCRYRIPHWGLLWMRTKLDGETLEWSACVPPKAYDDIHKGQFYTVPKAWLDREYYAEPSGFSRCIQPPRKVRVDG